MSRLSLALALALAVGCSLPQYQLPLDADVSCASDDDCLSEAFCHPALLRCFSAESPLPACVDADSVLADGVPCDDGICRSGACVSSVCGDGFVDSNIVAGLPREECDDGNDVDDDACILCLSARCGDGVVLLGGEECDDGNGSDDDACTNECIGNRCGDSFLGPDEDCDDGNAVDTDGCTAACRFPRCGDAFVQAGEQCDDGNDFDGDACTAACRDARCGDEIVRLGVEECDDGNDIDTDTCTGACSVAVCGDGFPQDGEQCDDGNDAETDGCTTACELPGCGDGFLQAGEQCDDNNEVDNDTCTAGCRIAACGDGILFVGFEVCDDDNIDSGDGCRGDCAKVEACGDAVADVGEDCDDGNLNPNDGCTDCRLTSWVPTLFVSGSVEGRAAQGVALGAPQSVVTAPDGRVYVADTGNHRVLRLEADGTLTRIAGNGTRAFSGDGGPATSASFFNPSGLFVDALGNVYVADKGNNRVRKIDEDGIVTTVAGGGSNASLGDGGPATAAFLFQPIDVAVDAGGRVFIADSAQLRVRRVDEDGVITTVAGTGAQAVSADGAAATASPLFAVLALAFDSSGRLLFGDGHRVRRINTNGTLTTVAGTGVEGFSGDGGPATAAKLALPRALFVDRENRLFIADKNNRRVRRVDASGTISTIATGAAGSSFLGPAGVTADSLGRVTVADANRLFRVELDGSVTAIAGNGLPAFLGADGPGTRALDVSLRGPSSVAVDALGRAVIAESDAHRIRRIELDGTITTLAGTGVSGSTGDGAPASSALLQSPRGLAIDVDGTIYFASGARVRRIGVDGTMEAFAGGDAPGFSGDGGPAESALLGGVFDVATGASGEVYLADGGNNRVRRVAADGTITTIAGTGAAGFSGDGGQAVDATLRVPVSVALDAAGRVFVLDSESRVRRVDVDGTITTVAGNGADGFSGDGGPATSASLFEPASIALDASGRLYIADRRNSRIRRVENGIITTVAGSALQGFAGDGGPATGARLSNPNDVVIDGEGRMYITEETNNLVRIVDENGVIRSVAGRVHPLGTGLVDRAALYGPRHLLHIGGGVLFSAGDEGRVMRIDDTAAEVVVGYTSPAASPLAAFAPALLSARGLALDDQLRLVIAEQGTALLHAVELDVDDDGVIDDAALWTIDELVLPPAAALNAPAGLVWDAESATLLVVDEGDHCVKRIDLVNQSSTVVAGECGVPGVFEGFLQAPTHVAVSPLSGAVFISDTANHRVVRVDASGAVDVVVGDRSQSSAGEGAPAALFPVDTPAQLAVDSFGNLFVTSRTSVRLVANVDGDDDADGDDRVFTIYGLGDRSSFPESASLCITGLALLDDARVRVSDACQGFVVELGRE